ncbi:ABC transporter permease [Amycolatopsis sp. NPDC051371]|uniref:ABC transporter permease n=1 Tax=Amycolatopsis sp. NPDC051371 TaxID=3155800 RepID=UPI003440F91A
MIRYALRRVPSAILVLLVASVVVFAVPRLTQGDAVTALAGPDATEETRTAIRQGLGLDQNVVLQYVHWLRGLVTGDLGTSYIRKVPAVEAIGTALTQTITLTCAALLLAVVLGALGGVLLGTSRRPLVTRPVGALVSLSFALPPYVTGVLLVLALAVTVRLLPAGGYVGFGDDAGLAFRSLLMPALCLALPAVAVFARFLGASIRQVMDEDFVRTGVAKGLPRRRLVSAHIVPNALPPVLAVLGIQVGQMLGGAIVVEAIFAWHGIGDLLVNSVLNRDYVLVQDLLLLTVAVFVVVQTLTDLAHAAVDPRVRLEA